MASVEATQLSAEGAGQLQEGIGLVLSRWSALQMAVENEWGGRDSRPKSQQLALDIFSWLTQSKEPLYIDDLEDMLDEFMLSLNTEIGDGSIEEIAEKLMVIHEECLEGNYKSIENLRETIPPRVAVPRIREADSDDDDDQDDEEESLGNDDLSKMAVDPPESQSNLNQKDMMVDEPKPKEASEAEDGWTVVASRRNRGGRN